MKLNKFNRLPRLLSEAQDESGTDVIEVDAQEVEAEGAQDEVRNDDGHDEGAAENAQPEGSEAAEDELIVTIGDASPAEDEEKSAPSWVKELRRKNREDQRKIRELEEQLNAVKGVTPTQDAPPKKPKLEDFDYDADEFERAMDAYYTQKAEHDKRLEAQKQAQAEQQKEWEQRQKSYIDGKGKYPAEKMQEAEEEVVNTLPAARQAMILDVADDPALIIYALGTNSDALKKLNAIKSDGRFIKELAKLEMNIKVQPKAKTPPPPERTISGSGRTPGAAAANLDALKTEAEKSGDYSKYFAEKRRLGK